jgi:hypothetical protein
MCVAAIDAHLQGLALGVLATLARTGIIELDSAATNAALASALHRRVQGETSPHRQCPNDVGAARPGSSLLNAVPQHVKRGRLERRQ